MAWLTIDGRSNEGQDTSLELCTTGGAFGGLEIQTHYEDECAAVIVIPAYDIPILINWLIENYAIEED